MKDMDVRRLFLVEDEDRMKRLIKNQHVLCEPDSKVVSQYQDGGVTVSLETCARCVVGKCATWTAIEFDRDDRILKRKMNVHATQVK